MPLHRAHTPPIALMPSGATAGPTRRQNCFERRTARVSLVATCGSSFWAMMVATASQTWRLVQYGDRLGMFGRVLRYPC